MAIIPVISLIFQSLCVGDGGIDGTFGFSALRIFN